MKRIITLAAALALCATGATAATISDGGFVFVERFEGTKMWFSPEKAPESARAFSLTVSGPDGFLAEVHTKRRIPSIDLREFLGYTGEDTGGKRPPQGTKELTDGYYSYELRFATDERLPVPEEVNNGREKPTRVSYRSYALGGSFLLDGGRIIRFEQAEEKPNDDPGKGDDEPSKDFDEGYKPGGVDDGRNETLDDSDRGKLR